MSIQKRFMLICMLVFFVLVGHLFEVLYHEPQTNASVREFRDITSSKCMSPLIQELISGSLKPTFLAFSDRTHLVPNLFFVILGLEVQNYSYTDEKAAILQYMDYLIQLSPEKLKLLAQKQDPQDIKNSITNQDLQKQFEQINMIYQNFCVPMLQKVLSI